MTQGYIVLATGPSQYLDMAVNLAASIKVMDPKRPICLAHDTGAALPPTVRALFDDAVGLPRDARYPHVMNKVRLFRASPYRQTMFVDADCLLVKHDVDHWWQAAATRPFSITGGKASSGEWKGIRIEDVLRQESISYLIKMNAGIFQYDKSDQAGEFFDGLEKFYMDRMNTLNITNYKGKNSQSFELYLGLYMGKLGLDCSNVANYGMNSWMVSTWRALYCDIQPAKDRSVIYKCDDFLLGMPFLPSTVRRLSPTFPHFIGLRPRAVYGRLVRGFHAALASGQRVAA